jgi:hypothetical protein
VLLCALELHKVDVKEESIGAADMQAVESLVHGFALMYLHNWFSSDMFGRYQSDLPPPLYAKAAAPALLHDVLVVTGSGIVKGCEQIPVTDE